MRSHAGEEGVSFPGGPGGSPQTPASLSRFRFDLLESFSGQTGSPCHVLPTSQNAGRPAHSSILTPAPLFPGAAWPSIVGADVGALPRPPTGLANGPPEQATVQGQNCLSLRTAGAADPRLRKESKQPQTRPHAAQPKPPWPAAARKGAPGPAEVPTTRGGRRAQLRWLVTGGWCSGPQSTETGCFGASSLPPGQRKICLPPANDALLPPGLPVSQAQDAAAVQRPLLCRRCGRTCNRGVPPPPPPAPRECQRGPVFRVMPLFFKPPFSFGDSGPWCPHSAPIQRAQWWLPLCPRLSSSLRVRDQDRRFPGAVPPAGTGGGAQRPGGWAVTVTSCRARGPPQG